MSTLRKYTIALLLLLALPAIGASVIRQAKDNIKKKSQLEQTAKTLLAEAEKEDTKLKTRVECLILAAECSQKLYEAENLKLYLKQKYDTAKFFSSIHDMFVRLEKADSIGALPDEKGRVKPVYRKRNHDVLKPFRANLLNGGRWHFRKTQMSQAYPFLDTYVGTASHPIFAADSLLKTDTLIRPTAYLAAVAAHMSNNPDGVIKHSTLAQEAGQKSHLIQEYLVKAWLAKGDSAQWLRALNDGIHHYPLHDYFFTHLIDYHIEKGEYGRCLQLADSMIQVADTVPLFWYAKSLVYLKQGKDREVIDACDSCLVRDDKYVDAYYNKGIASLNLAMIYAEKACTDINNPQCRRDREIVRSLYLLAKQPMEQVRKLSPNEPARWGAPLYRIYLNLNMGKEFEEIDAILNDLQ
ncbi:MAG: hypothetical protein K6A32_00460 [Bacteroidales bacterium]|nr:hypothetical protein [Bacteroidales bacterium]